MRSIVSTASVATGSRPRIADILSASGRSTLRFRQDVRVEDVRASRSGGQDVRDPKPSPCSSRQRVRESGLQSWRVSLTISKHRAAEADDPAMILIDKENTFERV